jgi:hypothetical protein
MEPSVGSLSPPLVRCVNEIDAAAACYFSALKNERLKAKIV